MTNYLPLKIDTSITESQDVTTQPNQQVTTVMSNGSVEMNGYSINNTDNFGRIEYYYFDNRYQYKIQSAATVSTLANRQAILQNQQGGVFLLTDLMIIHTISMSTSLFTGEVLRPENIH